MPEDQQVGADTPFHMFGKVSLNFGSGVYATDASGGPFADHPRLLRVGCAVVFMSQDDPFECETALAQILPGTDQSVSRGELYAVVMLARFAAPG